MLIRILFLILKKADEKTLPFFERRKMKYIDIKKDALRLMGLIPDTVGNDYDTSKIRAYTLGMNNSILRAIDRMRNLSLIPDKTIELPKSNKSEVKKFSLRELGILGEVQNVLLLDGLKILEADYVVIGDYLVLYVEKGLSYFIKYQASHDACFQDGDELDIPDDLGRLIPYFIKADLYEEEEPSLAVASRNMFEGYLKEYADRVDLTERCVKAVHLV